MNCKYDRKKSLVSAKCRNAFGRCDVAEFFLSSPPSLSLPVSLSFSLEQQMEDTGAGRSGNAGRNVGWPRSVFVTRVALTLSETLLVHIQYQPEDLEYLQFLLRCIVSFHFQDNVSPFLCQFIYTEQNITTVYNPHMYLSLFYISLICCNW